MRSGIAEWALERATNAAHEFPFVDQNFAAVAFSVSTLALLVLQPYSLLIGGIAGLFLHYYFEPNPVIEESDPFISVTHATMAIIAAMASLVNLTPAGAMGGYLFLSLPTIFSLSAGSCAYTAFRRCSLLFP